MKERGSFFVIPGIVWVLLFTIFPLVYSFRVSLSRVAYGRITGFAGLANYARMFQDYRFWGVLGFTLLFVVFSVVITVSLGLLLALVFNRKMRGLRFFRALMTTPLFTAPVALGYLGVMMFYEENGPINILLQTLGFGKVPWLSDIFWARTAVIMVDVWQWTPFAFIILLAGLQSLPDEVYEAAVLDTSSGWDIFRYITFPMISPVLGTVIMLRLVDAFKVFDIPFALTNGGPGTATRTLTFYVYTQGLRNFDLGYASAMAYFLMFMSLAVGIFFFRRYRSLYE
ncbi:MAG: multiple sugar transport system permease protein [Candidatus Atribacteria bacterium]|jgi:multiple sugar transport system permease protein|nr:multiple sugar transport system permease protein [Candidatus Atribacteria bacterium]